MRTLLVCLLAVVAVAAGGNRQPQPFKSQRSFVYRFDSQVASSMIGASPNEIQQAAATRLRAEVRISFNSDSQARLQLQHVRIGEMNGEMPKSQRVQPLESFDRRELPQEVKQMLEMPLGVQIVDGVVEKINFHRGDAVWSKNIKRAVLNMLQLNLKQNDVQGLGVQKDDQKAPLFVIPEATLEGECSTVYSIQKSPLYDQESNEGLFNVTKTIDFNKCNRTADLTFGYQTNPAQQLRCFNCIRQRQPQPNAEEAEKIRFSHCQMECQPSKINEDNDVERSTYGRYELMGKQEEYAIQRVSMLSQYVVKAQNPASQNAVIQIVSMAELTFKEQTDDDKMVPDFQQDDREEKLTFSAEWSLAEKRFYMAGDEQFEKNSPFQADQKKQHKVAHALRSILKQWGNEELGYELDSALHFNRFVMVLRESSVKELRNIEDLIRSGAQQNDREQCWCAKCDEQCEQHAKSLFLDGLAVAATRNTLYILGEKIVKGDIPTAKAVQTLQTFISNQHSPSEQQADILERIVKHEIAHRSPALKQTALLSFGSAVGAICQNKPAEGQKEIFRVEELCSRGKKEQYKKTLLQQLKQSESTYEQILVLKAIGNAALDNTIESLKQLIQETRQSTLVRMEAIDAMRRLRTGRAEKIRQALLPIFQNQREQPEIRMAAFSMIMYTLPQKAVLDQLTFTVMIDRSQNVKSFVMSAMETLSRSPSSAEQEVANHMKGALKMVKMNGQQERPSRKYQVPIYVSAQENVEEQNVFLGLASIVSPSNMIPIHLSASLRSAFGGEATEENVQLSFTQKNLEKLYEKMNEFAHSYIQSSDEEKDEESAKNLRSIYSSLGIKNRRTGSYYLSNDEEEDQSVEETRDQTLKTLKNEPFGMIVIRTNDIDAALIPISEQQMPQIVRKILNKEKPSMTDFEQMTQRLASGPKYQQHGAISVGEKKTEIPTSAGFPLSLFRQTTAVASIRGELKMHLESEGLENGRGVNAELKLRTSGIATHMHKAEVWTPVLISGVETVRTIELNSPFEMKMVADKTKIEMTIRPPQEQKIRIFGIHTLPVTFVTQFDLETRTRREPRVRSVRNHLLEQTQREHHMSEHSEKVIVLDGHFHQLMDPKQLIHALYTTENNLHVYFQPSERTPKELKLRLTGSVFQKHSGQSKPEMEGFYSTSDNKKGFQSIFDDEEEAQMGVQKDNERHSRLSTFTQQYDEKTAYKHELKVEAEARYAQKTHKMMAELKGVCDARLKHCKLFLDAERSPIGTESQKWTMKSKIQTVAPEIVRREENPTEKQSRLLIQVDNEWGSDRKNSMNLRLQAEPTRMSMWKESEKFARFLNKIDLVAEYHLGPQQKHLIQQVYEMLKAKMFWKLDTDEHKGEEGLVRASALIDPITRRYANVSIQTADERVRVQNLHVPAQIFSAIAVPLERRPANVQSMGGLLKQVTSVEKAKCRAGDTQIRTFDGVSYRAPLSSCWTVLAKDCSREEPHFVVLMKKTGGVVDPVKKVKIITTKGVIELTAQSQNEKLKVKIDGEHVKEEGRLEAEGIQMHHNKVFITKRGIQVEFDGEEAKIQIGAEYKNLQCGLCGHYNDEEEDVFRMNDNRQSQNLKEFHRSFVLKNEECSEAELNKHYARDSSEFVVRRSHKNRKQQQHRDEWSLDSDEEEDRRMDSQGQQWLSSSEQMDEKNIKPVQQTEVMEYNHKICFSTEPVQQCPRGSTADDEAETKGVQAQFFCLERTSVDARRLQRHARKGQLVESEGRPVAFTQTVQQPTKCLAF